MSIYFYNSKAVRAEREATVKLTVTLFPNHSAPQIQERKSNQRPFKYQNHRTCLPHLLDASHLSQIFLCSKITDMLTCLAPSDHITSNCLAELRMFLPWPEKCLLPSCSVVSLEQREMEGRDMHLSMWLPCVSGYRETQFKKARRLQNWMLYLDICSLRTKCNPFPHSYVSRNGWMY